MSRTHDPGHGPCTWLQIPTSPKTRWEDGPLDGPLDGRKNNENTNTDK